MSKYEEKIIKEIEKRAKKGLNKYGTTMERDDLSTADWLQHGKEEALDLAVYLERLIDAYEVIEEVKQYTGSLKEIAKVMKEACLALFKKDYEQAERSIESASDNLLALAELIESL